MVVRNESSGPNITAGRMRSASANAARTASSPSPRLPGHGSKGLYWGPRGREGALLAEEWRSLREAALAVRLLRLQPMSKLLAHHGGKKPPHRVWLPAGGLHDAGDGGAARPAQQSQHSQLL